MRSRVLSALIVATAVVVTLFVAAPRAGAAPPDPCSLLTTAEVSDALGIAVTAGQPANPTLCAWAAGGKRLTLLITDDQHFAGAKKAGTLPGVTFETVSGVGDEALLTTTGEFASIMVRKGAAYFMLRVYGFPLDQAKAKEKTLAADAAKKI
jgi:hypothetical protein